MKLQAAFELIKGIVFLTLGVMIFWVGPKYLVFEAWQRQIFGIILLGYGAMKLFMAWRYYHKEP